MYVRAADLTKIIRHAVHDRESDQKDVSAARGSRGASVANARRPFFIA